MSPLIKRICLRGLATRAIGALCIAVVMALTSSCSRPSKMICPVCGATYGPSSRWCGKVHDGRAVRLVPIGSGRSVVVGPSQRDKAINVATKARDLVDRSIRIIMQLNEAESTRCLTDSEMADLARAKAGLLEALASAKRAVDADPGLSEGWNQSIRAHFYLGHYVEAEHMARTAAQRFPTEERFRTMHMQAIRKQRANR